MPIARWPCGVLECPCSASALNTSTVELNAAADAISNAGCRGVPVANKNPVKGAATSSNLRAAADE